MNAPTRIAAKLFPSEASPKVRHYVGMPPELTEGQETRRGLPPTSVLLIDPSESGVFLIRFTADGRMAGDTWHPTVSEAQEQAAYEFGGAVSMWETVPTDINDIVAFMLRA